MIELLVTRYENWLWSGDFLFQAVLCVGLSVYWTLQSGPATALRFALGGPVVLYGLGMMALVMGWVEPIVPVVPVEFYNAVTQTALYQGAQAAVLAACFLVGVGLAVLAMATQSQARLSAKGTAK